MLGQIRRHIAKKNEKLFYIFVLFIVAFGISIVHYMFLEKDAEIIQDVLGSYEINNHFDIKNIFKGYSADEGKITVKLIDEDTCIYLDCSSNINTSKPKTISKINLLENEDFSNYKCYFISEKRLKDKNVYTLMEGESLKSNSKIKLHYNL